MRGAALESDRRARRERRLALRFRNGRRGALAGSVRRRLVSRADCAAPVHGIGVILARVAIRVEARVARHDDARAGRVLVRRAVRTGVAINVRAASFGGRQRARALGAVTVDCVAVVVAREARRVRARPTVLHDKAAIVVRIAVHVVGACGVRLAVDVVVRVLAVQSLLLRALRARAIHRVAIVGARVPVRVDARVARDRSRARARSVVGAVLR
mmetsp:Transcript_8162/g.25809  ORF Transcript_8162/g.25809 Transcript_8162/m.25809 type:complete len:214 (+) Transcript_8162:1465-2106(+)